MKTLLRLCVLMLLGVLQLAEANPYQVLGPGVQGVVLAAEHRFNPAVQRYLAEQSLDALPLVDGKLYYVFPMHGSNAQLESMQIHNLERLLDKQARERSEAAPKE